jgi:hypothetical protein
MGFHLAGIHTLSDGGKHYAFEMSNGVEVAFFWFLNAPQSAPGIASVKPDAWQTGDISTAHELSLISSQSEPGSEGKLVIGMY